MVCETYYSAIRTASPRQIEAIDRERTKLHNEGAELLARAPQRKVAIDGDRAAPVHADLRPALEVVTRREPRPPRLHPRQHAAARPAARARTEAAARRRGGRAVDEDRGGARRMGLPPPFWAFAWAGGQALARYIARQPELVAGRRVLDFATGSGLVAIAAALAGAARGRGERDRRVRARRDRAQRRRATASRSTSLAGDIVGRDDGWDVVLAGDVSYERDMAEAVTDWLAASPPRRDGADRRPRPHLSRPRPAGARRRIRRAGDARAGGRGDQAHGRVRVQGGA